MPELLQTVAVAVASFVGTNIDDLILLTLFFSQVNGASFKNRDVVTGQYLGFCALVAVSLVGLLLGVLLPQRLVGLLGLIPIVLGVMQMRKWREPAQEPSPEDVSRAQKRSSKAVFARLMSPMVYQVAAVTVANGADNIGTYVPLFAGVPGRVPALVAMYLVLVAVWCFASYRLVKVPAVSKMLARYGCYIIPFVFIAIGLGVLWESGTLGFLRLT